MPFITVVANVALEGRWGKTQKHDICSRDPFRHSLDVTWLLSNREFWDLESKMAEEWSMKDTVAPRRLVTSRPHESQGRMC